MTIEQRPYDPASDYTRVSAFLIAHHQAGNRDGNWLEPAWEYMHFHSLLDSASLAKIGVWEEGGAIVAVAHYEWALGEAFFQFHPAYRHLRAEMLDYAEANLTGVSRQDGRPTLCAYVNDNDPDFLALVGARGYAKDPEGTRPLYRFAIPDPFPAIPLADGFRLTSLAEEPDWAKVHRALWRGFDHEGEPPMSDEEMESRRRMFDTPKARRDLKIAVAAPDGEFVAFAGTFYEPAGRFAYVEPVATDPAYRRLGLGRAAVLEGIRRCASLGATVAYVGSDQAFYRAIGFEKVYHSECWVKHLG
ncbi:MAG: GNAT family N-acetyltransferase [Chloroflexi bacterium]|nr:GNAT family N-acetyltransferase [Chloroflexota bacterium]